MPRVVDRRPRRVADKDPLAGLLGYDLTDAAEQAGKDISNGILKMRDEFTTWLKETTGIDLTAANQFFDYLLSEILSRNQLDLSSPEKFIESLGDLLKTGAEELFNNSVIAISRIGNVIQDLINGAGEFLNADSVKTNPFWSWDSVMPGWLSGGSIRASANGTQQVLRKDNPFDVFPGQVLNLRAGARWTGFTAAAGSNPIKVGWTPYDASGNPMADVIKGTLQPSTTDAAGWQQISVDAWTVPAGVAKATPLLILDSGATAGNVWMSNVMPWASNLLDLSLVRGLQAALDTFTSRIKSLFDTIGGAIGADVAEIEARLAAIGADGKIDAAELANIVNIPAIAVGKISGLVEQLAGYALKSAVQTFMDTVGGTVGASMTDIFNRLSKLSSTGTMAGSAITGAIAEAQTGMDFFRDFLVNGMGGVGSNFTNTDAKNQAIQLQQTAAQAAAATAAIQAQWQRQQVTVPSGLLSYITTFGGADGVSLPPEFSGSDLEIRTANGYCGIDASRGDGTYFAPCSKVATTDDVQVTVTLGDGGGLNSIATYELFSSDAAYTTGAYFGINGNQAFVGKYSRSGSTFTFNAPFLSWSGPLGQGLSATVYRKTNNWVLDVGGDVKATTTNSTVTTGASNRSGGAIVMQRKTASGGWFDGNHLYDSLRLASLYFGDFYAKSTFYSGAKMTRPGGSNINGPSHAYNLPQGSSTTFSGVLPANFYSLQNFASDDVTVNVPNGSITINNPGLYYVHYDLPWTTFSFGAGIGANGVTTDVVVNTVNHIPLVSQETQTIPAGNDGSGGGTINLYWDKPEFLRLNAGDVVQLGYTLGIKNTGIGSRSGNANMAYANGSGFFGIYKLG
ncbi:hypothetical protein [Mycobacteroides abscessus]|uniref:hypothetical protein n=1 Tax=Mycobacteroides abscessus TaxID=36809 RepID=UPI0005E92305|nr:hypothetical protein [Mycobacteroides abscessus]CPR79123.1 Bacteriophage protein [Mycobacteroides abscessus]CPR88289.1 Bacteriophage protein [Mycobacteroides abscessus]CPS43243.1 Bacteriophage protein [Mycobacteroides abscessus]CPV03031.1 Bacteriophage protein [Mycobacteroides abscessus]